MTRSTSANGEAMPRRSRRAILSKGAAGALGVIAFEALANAPKAQAQTSLSGGAFTSGFAPAVVTLSQSGGAVAVDASQGNTFTLTLTASGWTISSPVNPVGDGQVIRIRLAQDSTGGRTISWDTAYNWGSSGGTANSAPSLSSAGNATDILSFEYVAALSQWCFLGTAFPQAYIGTAKPPAISVIQSTYVSFDTQGNFASNVTPGNSIVLIAALYSVATSGTFSTSNPQFGSLGNSVPGTVLLQGTGPFEGQGEGYTAVWLLPNVAGNATFFRLDAVVPPPGGPHGIFAYEVAGLGAAPQLDPGGGTAIGTGYSEALDSGVCPAINQPAEIAFGFGHIYDPNLTAPSSAWTAQMGGGIADFWTGYQVTDIPGTTFEWKQTADAVASWGAGVVAICPQPVA